MSSDPTTTAAAYPPALPAGCYVEGSAEGWAVWMVDEDGDWTEMPGRGVVDAGSFVAYYRVEDAPAWQGHVDV